MRKPLALKMIVCLAEMIALLALYSNLAQYPGSCVSFTSKAEEIIKSYFCNLSMCVSGIKTIPSSDICSGIFRKEPYYDEGLGIEIALCVLERRSICEF